ncbi:MAG: GAF domain-containing protein, partial [Nitrospirae bacterium]
VRLTQLFVNLIEWLSEYLVMNDTILISVEKNDFVDISISLAHRLPDEAVSLNEKMRSAIVSNLPEEQLKFYIAKRIADAHRWRFEINNSQEGFSITIRIPDSSRNRVNAIVDSCLNRFIELVSEVLDVNICSIMLSDELTGDLVIRGALGLSEDVVKRTRLRPGDRIAGWVALEGKPLLIEDIERDPRFSRTNIPQYNTKSLLSIPVKIDDRVVGVLNLNNKKSQEPFNRIDLYIARELSNRISNFLKRLYSESLSEDEVRHFMTTLENLVFIQKKYHKRQPLLPDLMMRLLEILKATEEQKSIGVYVSMFYDLGLITVDESVLRKKEIQPSERRSLRIHPFTTVSLLNNFEHSGEVKRAILHHHEHYDGTGYPDGLKGEEIPFLSRVLAVVDSFCAMISERPYRKAVTKDEALRQIKAQAGTVYDPLVVEALEKAIKP